MSDNYYFAVLTIFMMKKNVFFRHYSHSIGRKQAVEFRKLLLRTYRVEYPTRWDI